MSYDINFWKQSQPLEMPPSEIYGTLCNGDTVEGLEALPIDTIYERIRAAFPSFDPKEDFPVIEFEHCGIEVSSSPQHVRFDIRGDIGSETNRLIEILAEFGCPLYDPQIDQRFDQNDGVDLGVPPKFEDMTDEQRAAQKQAMDAAMQRLFSANTPQKKGCARAALIVVGLISTCALAIFVA